MTEPVVLHCVNHPDRETMLRCAKCNAPICSQCARRTPTGYICPDCQRGLRKKFENALWYDYIIGFIVPAIGSWLGSLIVPLIGMIFYGILIIFYAPFIGSLIGRINLRALRKHRSKALFRTALAGFVIGAIPNIVLSAMPFFLSFDIYALFPLLWQIVYLALAIPAFYHDLTGIHFKL